MPDSIDISEPDGPAVIETPPEYLAIQAPPAIVGFAERTHQDFLESLQSRVTTALGMETRASFMRTEQSFLARYLQDLETGSHNVFLSLEPLSGCALVRFSRELLLKVLDIVLASPAAAVSGVRGEFVTEIELHVLRGFFAVFAEGMRETWRSIPAVALTPSLGRGEEMLANYGDSHMLALKSAIEIDGAFGDFDVVMPAFLVRLSARSSGLKSAETTAIPNRITRALGSAQVDLDAVLSNLTVKIGDLVELAPGQILLAEKTANSTFECLVNKRTQFRGDLVSAGDRYGFQLARTVLADDEAGSPTDR